jgi:APA family basic amino acid/polyamine antiporter
MAGVSVLLLRRRYPHLPRPYRVWGYPIVPLVFVAAMLAFVADVWVRRPAESWIGIALLAAGVPLYGVSEWLRRSVGPLGGAARRMEA